MKLIQTLASARHELPRLIPLMRDARVPMWGKAAAIVAAVVIVSPLNILGDIPILGIFDDGALLLFVIHQFVKFAEKETGTIDASVESPPIL